VRQIQRSLADPAFRKNLDGLIQESRQAAKARTWFQVNHPNAPLICAAYFSMESMSSEALPIYSDGLGNAAITCQLPAIWACPWWEWDCSASKAIFAN